MLTTSVRACMLLLSHILVSHSFKKFQIRLYYLEFPRWFSGKESARNAGDTGDIGLILMSGRSLGEGNGNLLQYSCLKNPMDRGAWRATVHGGCKELDTIEHTSIDRHQRRCEHWNTWLIITLYWKTTVCVIKWLIQDFSHVIWLKKKRKFSFFLWIHLFWPLKRSNLARPMEMTKFYCKHAQD